MPDPDELQHFQDVLRDLFQFDVADLDFGVYRILNEKRDDIERFIEEDLVEGVREELRAYEEGQAEALREEVEEAKQTVQETLSEYAIQSDGTVKEEYRDLKAAQDYRDARERLEAAELSKETERRIYDDLARFFRRFYDNGDFVTKRRFSAGDSTYYVPYDGEETLLHWANREQYYVKTTEHFRDYRFTARDIDVHFRLVDAQVPQDNVKAGDTRYFVLQGDDPVTVDPDAGTCTVQFAYRPITEEEDERLLALYNEDKSSSNTRKTNDRRTIVAATTRQILDAIDDATIRTQLGEPEDEDDTPLLRRHLNRYTAKNTADYFVHKNLGDFLRGQLEFFIQNEVLALDEVLAATEQRRLQQVDRAKAVKKIGERIISFLAQIEDFQKRLFEKKKFVADTGYCVTLDRVPDDLYDTILGNDDQLDEWRDLYSVDEWDDGLFNQGYEDGTFTRAFLEAHPHVMVDTRHFESDFEDRLLAHLSNTTDGGLSDAVDGLCLQGENFQALSLLRERFKEKVDCVYIDPPYNTGNDNFVYKDSYRHSTWMAMMEDRMRAAKGLLDRSGVYFTSIDDVEQEKLRTLLDYTFGEDNFLAHIVWQKRYVSNATAKYLSDMHDHIFFFGRDKEKVQVSKWPRTEEQLEAYQNPDDDPRGPWRPQDLSASKPYSKGQYTIVTPAGREVNPPPGRYWRCSKEQYEEWLEDDRIWFGKDGTGRPMLKGFLSESQDGVTPHTWWDYDFAGHNKGAKLHIKSLFGNKEPYSTPKPVELMEKIVDTTEGEEDLVLDYFAGSGTTGEAVVNLNREEDFGHSYLLIEMGDYFDTVMLPRLKKVVFTNEWKDGVPEDRNGQSHVMKYHRLESYEDTLNNIEVHRPEAEPSLLDRFDDYALRYMLPHETRDSETLLAPDAFQHPFDYTLQIQHGMESPSAHPVDLESTFNYLIGLEVEARRVYEHQDRRYVVVTGTVEKEQSIDTVMIVWRNQDDLDLDTEKVWAAETLPNGPFDTVYANGTSHIHGQAEPLEIEFKRRMDPAVG
jgi:adenine-specific DNA-methyltransferase